MDLHFYSTFPVYWPLKPLYITCHIHPFTHTFIHWWHGQRLPCMVPTCSSGAQYLTQRCFDMQPGEPGIRASVLPITGKPASPPEEQPAPLSDFCCGQDIVWEDFASEQGLTLTFKLVYFNSNLTHSHIPIIIYNKYICANDLLKYQLSSPQYCHNTNIEVFGEIYCDFILNPSI